MAAGLRSLLSEPIWDEAQLACARIPVADARFVTVGGGLGSFAVADFLRVAGVAGSEIRILSRLPRPWETLEALANASQLGRRDRLRSDSMSRIDNVWGWPGYAISEALHERAPWSLVRVLGEPLLCEYFTPRLGTVIRGLERECARIGWEQMLVSCEAQVVRRRRAGGYFVLVRSQAGSSRGYIAYRARYVHLGVGYPAPRGLRELIALRRRDSSYSQVVKGYEPHDHVYAHLIAVPGRVLVRGCGITASRILERLIHDRDQRGARTEIVHLFRSEAKPRGGLMRSRRLQSGGFSYQPFTFPKAAGGGQLRMRTLALAGEERARLIRTIGGTTTPRRRRWQRQLRRGRREGWYRDVQGDLLAVTGGDDGRLIATLCRPEAQEHQQLVVDYSHDGTVRDDDFRSHPVVADLLAVGGASTNSMSRLDVDANFEVAGTRSGDGRLYASGAATLGCALGPVDSFWGLTQAALEICDDLARQDACEFPGPLRSVAQWWRWASNREP